MAAHHAHILRGIETYRGKPIFHGLGNWVTVTRALTPGQQDDADREAWAAERLELFGFTPDPAMPTYPFHPEGRNTMAGVVDVGADGSLSTGFVPCWIDDHARPVPCDPTQGRGADVVSYVEAITKEAGFRLRLTVRSGGSSGSPEPRTLLTVKKALYIGHVSSVMESVDSRPP